MSGPKVLSTERRRSGKLYFFSYLRNWQLYLLILPAAIYLFVFNYIPMYGLQIAFKDFIPSLGITGSPWVGFKHFERFITFPNFRLILTNTARIGAYTLATFPCSIILSLLINEITKVKFKKTVQMITYMPYFLSTVVVCSMILLFFHHETGFINGIIASFGGEKIPFMITPEIFPHVYVWSGVWQTIGWGTIIYLAALSGVSPDLIEAARVDGANRMHIIWHINIPTILPTITILLILSSGAILATDFAKVLLLQNPLNLSASQVIATYVYDVGLLKAQFSYASAIGFFNTIINVTILLIVNFIAKRVSGISLW